MHFPLSSKLTKGTYPAFLSEFDSEQVKVEVCSKGAVAVSPTMREPLHWYRYICTHIDPPKEFHLHGAAKLQFASPGNRNCHLGHFIHDKPSTPLLENDMTTEMDAEVADDILARVAQDGSMD